MRFWMLLAVVVLAIWFAWPFGHAGVLRPLRVDNRQLPALDAADVAQMSPEFPPASAAMALQLERAGVQRRVWPLKITQAMRTVQAGGNSSGGLSGAITFGSAASGAPTPQPKLPTHSGMQLLEAWPRGKVRTRRVAFDGRVFYLLMAGPGLERMPHFDTALTGEQLAAEHAAERIVIIAAEEGKAAPAASFVTQGEPRYIMDGVRTGTGDPVRTQYKGPWSFATVTTDNGPLVIYRDKGGIYARRLETGGERLAFGERWRIASAPNEINHYQLAARADSSGRIHVLWSLQPDSETQGGNAHLAYCRIKAVEGHNCAEPQILSRTTAWQPVNLMVQDGRVYASWVDTRHTEGIWDRRNYAKLYFTVSNDSGASFSNPVSINRPRDNSDNVFAPVTMPAADGGVLVFWASRRNDPGRLPDQTYQAGWLNAALKQFTLGSNVLSGRDLYEAIKRSLLTYHENLASEER